jgi:uncharacterized cupredoxin-like copper-binding protein
MRKLSFPVSAAVMGILLLSGCGSSAAAQAQPAVQSADLTPMRPQTVTNPEALIGNGSEIVIALGDNTIDSSQTTFKAGVPYTFVITNSGTRAHQFNINEPVEVKGSFQGAISGALLTVPKDQLDPGQSVTLEFTFPASAAKKAWEFSCLIRNHYEDGMRWAIVVTQ